MNADRRRQIRFRAEAAAKYGDKYGAVFSPRLGLELLDRLDQLEEVAMRALENIADEDELVTANEDAFSVYALRHCQEIARFALAHLNEETE